MKMYFKNARKIIQNVRRSLNKEFKQTDYPEFSAKGILK